MANCDKSVISDLIFVSSVHTVTFEIPHYQEFCFSHSKVLNAKNYINLKNYVRELLAQVTLLI